MRIALIGPASTGKTTLAHSLSKELHLPVISECIRTSAKNLGIANISTIDRDTRIMLQADALRLQQSIEGIYKSGFIADRSSLDYAAYVRGFFGECSFEEVYTRTAATSEYELLIYVPHFDDAGQRDDGFRLNASAFAKVEEEVRKQLSREAVTDRMKGKNCHYHRLISNGYEARINEVKQIVHCH